MRKILFSFLLISMASSVFAQWINDQNNKFKINVPSKWSQESKFDGTDQVYDLMDPSQNIFLEIRAFKVDNQVNADALAKAFESQFLATANRVAYENYTLNNTPGKFAGYTLNIDGLEVGVGAFYAAKNGIGYILWSMIETRLYNQYSAQADAVLNTFTTTAGASGSKKYVVGAPKFKITNMKLGSKLTADYNISPGDITTSFKAEQNEIFVIWDWEGKSTGKQMTINWFYKGQRIADASQSYKLPNNDQGYGWASLKKPASGFKAGSYYVQIDFEGNKQRRIDFKISKPKSNQSSGFVIKPPGGDQAQQNNNSNNTSGKDFAPSNQNASSFSLDFHSIKLGEELQQGSKTTLVSTSKKFYKNTPQVISVFKWKGNGSGHKVKCSWRYYPPGASENMLIAETEYAIPGGNGGGSNFSLSKPDNGWPLGQYWVEYELDGQFFEEIRFDVIEGASSNSSSSVGWGKASGGSSKGSSSTANVQTTKVVLVSGGSKSCYSFKSGKVHGDHQSADIMVEPWCTEDAGLCGNWVLTGQSNMSAVNSAPSSGYISEGKSYVDCQTMPKNNVAVVKLKDGSYAKIMIQNTSFSQSQSQNPPCQHKTTFLIEYPAF